jgi:hypothetical protein
MSKHYTPSLAMALLMLSVLACNLPGPAGSPPKPTGVTEAVVASPDVVLPTTALTNTPAAQNLPDLSPSPAPSQTSSPVPPTDLPSATVVLPTVTSTAIPPSPTLPPSPTPTFTPAVPTPSPAMMSAPVVSTQAPSGQRPALNTLNKIANPNFTTGQYNYTAPDGTVITGVPAEWLPWADLSVGGWPHYEEEQHPAHHFVESDWASWRFYTEYSNFRGGLMQHFFDLQPGAVYRANCWMFAHAGEPGVGLPSEGYINLRMGIDPLNGNSPDAPSIVWGITHANMIGSVANVQGDVYTAHDLFDPYTVIFIAPSPSATLWVEARTTYPFHRNEVWIDSCEMRAIGWAEDFGMR